MAEAQDLAGVVAALGALGRRMDTMEQRMQVAPGGQCSAAYPHPDRLVFIRGTGPAGNHYACSCGMLYRKDGQGGLLEVV